MKLNDSRKANPVIGWVHMNLGQLLGLFALCIIVTLMSDKFISKDNFLNILKSVSTNMMLACALTMVIILGLIDISVGSTVGLAGIVCATLVGSGKYPVWQVFALCLVIGLFMGLINGILIAYIKIPAFIATLATQNVGRAREMLGRIFHKTGNDYDIRRRFNHDRLFSVFRHTGLHPDVQDPSGDISVCDRGK